jgi:hypothetical protein
VATTPSTRPGTPTARPTQAIPPPGWATIQDYQHEARFAYPPGWQRRPSKYDFVFYAEKDPAGNWGIEQVGFAVLTSTDPDTALLVVEEKEYSSEKGRQLEDPVTVPGADGEPARQMSGSYARSDTTAYYVLRTVQASNRTYVIMSRDASGAEAEKLLDEFARTFTPT